MSEAFTVRAGNELRLSLRFREALAYYRAKRAFMISRDCPSGYTLEMTPPDGVKFTTLQYLMMFDDQIPLAYLEDNPHGKRPHTCGHGLFERAGNEGFNACECSVCGHAWREYPLALEGVA